MRKWMIGVLALGWQGLLMAVDTQTITLESTVEAAPCDVSLSANQSAGVAGNVVDMGSIEESQLLGLSQPALADGATQRWINFDVKCGVSAGKQATLRLEGNTVAGSGGRLFNNIGSYGVGYALRMMPGDTLCTVSWLPGACQAMSIEDGTNTLALGAAGAAVNTTIAVKGGYYYVNTAQGAPAVLITSRPAGPVTATITLSADYQ